MGSLLLALALLVQIVASPYAGIVVTTRTERVPRPVRLHVATIDLTTPGVRLALTGPAGPLEVVRRRTADHVREAGAQLGINGHFFLPFPSAEPEANLIGLAASEGRVFSAFETPAQAYALVADAPALNIGPDNRAEIVHRDPASADGRGTRGTGTLWTTIAGSAQIVTDGAVTIPVYRDAEHPDARLTPGGPAQYSNGRSWYEAVNARTAIGLSRDGRTLTLVAVEARAGSQGLTVRELAEWLVRDYGVWNALNLDGGGSTTMVVVDPETGEPRTLTTSADGPDGRAVGSSLLVFAPRR